MLPVAAAYSLKQVHCDGSGLVALLVKQGRVFALTQVIIAAKITAMLLLSQRTTK